MSIEQFQREVEHLGETPGCRDHDHDMVHELSRRLDALWRYDQYISNAEEHDNIKNFWIRVKDQEQKNISELKDLLADHILNKCF